MYGISLNCYLGSFSCHFSLKISKYIDQLQNFISDSQDLGTNKLSKLFIHSQLENGNISKWTWTCGRTFRDFVYGLFCHVIKQSF